MPKLILQLKTPVNRGDIPPIGFVAGEILVTDEGFIFNADLPPCPVTSVCFLQKADVGLVVSLTDETDLSALAENPEFLLAVTI